jgi:glycosyltransferase involved in cell wall biosynthesis
MIAPQPFYEVRGTPINVLLMCRVLTEAGYRVDLATYPLGRDVELPGLSLHRTVRVPGLRTVPIGFSKRKVLVDLFLGATVTALLARRTYAVVHAIEEAVFLAVPLARLRRIPVIYDLDSILSHQLELSGVLRSRPLLRLARRLERGALRRASAALTVSAPVTAAVREMQPSARVFQIEDAPIQEALRRPEPERVRELREGLGLGGRPVVVYTGNLEGYQGIELLLGAARGLRERVPGAVVVLVGGEEHRAAALRERLAGEEAGEAVRIVGPRPVAEMAEWMAMGDLLVSPRAHGGNTPLKIYTYMASGIPIVATDIPAHHQVLDASVAFLAPPTPAGLAEVLAAALADPAAARARAAAAHARVEAEYGFQAFGRKLLAAYAAVLAAA